MSVNWRLFYFNREVIKTRKVKEHLKIQNYVQRRTLKNTGGKNYGFENFAW